MNNPVATVTGGEFPSFPQVNFSSAVPPGFAYGNCPEYDNKPSRSSLEQY
ncbi:hypothetical protein T09_6524 [Trichinella sp. T9]|nr:hypothetical protein T09_6524 [Trichinella sp. T9]